MIAKIKDWFYESLFFQLICEVSLTVGIGVLSGTFVTEITQDGKLAWESWYLAVSTYLIFFLSVMFALLKWTLFKHEKEMMNFLSNDYCIAYARSQMLPEAAKRAKEIIRNGKGGEFKDAMDEIKKVLK